MPRKLVEEVNARHVAEDAQSLAELFATTNRLHWARVFLAAARLLDDPKARLVPPVGLVPIAPGSARSRKRLRTVGG
jgi:hypothetical protein